MRLERFIPEGKAFCAELTDVGDVAAFYYARATQADDHVAWSSPIWFE